MREGWKEIRLGEVCHINKNNLKKDYPYSEITYLDISSVGSGDVDFNNIVSISEAPSRAKRIPTSKDSIIATVRPGNRTFAYLKEFPNNTVVSTGFAILSPKENLIDSRFLYYVISEHSFTDYLVSTQRKIASILSAYDDLIENNLKRIKLLEEKAQLTYEEWFVRMKFPGHETAVFDEESGLPEGWERK
jgi:type I restriction enzyme, S subunit